MSTDLSPDLMPRWELQDPSQNSAPRSLLDELVETGTLTKEFNMPGHFFEVKTRVNFNPQAWLFRCAVLCDGGEVLAPPWVPIFRDLTPEIAGRAVDGQLRLELARQALETHLATAARVARQLEEHGRLSAPPPRSNNSLVFGLIALVAVAVGVGWALWDLKTATERAATDPTSQTADAVENGPPPAESEGTASETPPEAAATPAPSPAPAGPIAEAPAPTPEKPRTQQKPTPETKPISVAPRSSPPPPPPAPKPEPPPPLEVDELAVEPPPPAVAEEEQAAAEILKDRLFSDVLPRAHEVVQLEPGSRVYYEDTIIFSFVPPAYLRLTCVTTARPDVDAVRSIAFTLERSMEILVAHDQRVKKQPQWLQEFQMTGEEIRAYDRATGEEIVYALYRKRFTAGSVALGVNAEPSRLMGQLHKVVGKSVAMYLVCFDDSEG